jgi:hypothetical protein
MTVVATSFIKKQPSLNRQKMLSMMKGWLHQSSKITNTESSIVKNHHCQIINRDDGLCRSPAAAGAAAADVGRRVREGGGARRAGPHTPLARRAARRAARHTRARRRQRTSPLAQLIYPTLLSRCFIYLPLYLFYLIMVMFYLRMRMA